MEFKDVLNDLLVERNLTVQDLSKQIAIDDSILYDYCNGGMPSIKYAVTLANYFDCSLSYLMGLVDNPKSFVFSSDYDMGVFSPRYEKLLHDNKTTHFKVSKESGLNYSSNYAWKRGSIPAMSSLIIIARYFDESIDYLVGRSDRV